MQVSVYTRHSSDCPHLEDPHWKRCNCRKWLYCSDWTPSRRTADTRSWSAAERVARALEQGLPTETVATQPIADAVRLFLEDKREQKISDNYSQKLKREMEDFAAWCRIKPVMGLPAIKLIHLEEYRKTWKGASVTRQKRQERLRSFFLYCQKHEWIQTNASRHLSAINVNTPPTLPFSPEQYAAILESVENYAPDSENRDYLRQRARAMIQLLRWSGLRLGDASRLERVRLGEDGRLLLRMEKTNEPVYTLLPPRVTEDLHALKNPNPLYFFWSGQTKKETPVYRWWETLKAIFRGAGMPTAHPHQFRHTFAVELLVKGVDIKHVSTLLGHRKVEITERYYAAWIKSRQELLEESVRKSW